jgi:sporulation protein YlmC with PRC-barrel domain
MLTTFKQSFKTLVQSKNDDLPTGLLLDMVINPETGVFEAFWVKSLEGQKLLLPKDIISWDTQQITINDSNDLSTPEALPRLRKIFEKECSILKARVFDRAHNKFLGTVRDFTFDTISPRLLALEVEKNWFGYGRHRIPQHRIIKIKADQITVDSSVLKTEPKPETVKNKIPVLDVPELDGPSRKEK